MILLLVVKSASVICFPVPAGLCSLYLVDVNSSSVSVSWDNAHGEFDFYRVTVANNSVTRALIIPKEELVAVVTGLGEGCSYNVSAERVRGVTAGSGASLSVSTGRRYNKSTVLLTSDLIASSLNIPSCFSPSSVHHECQPMWEVCVSWMCLHVHSHCTGNRHWGVWIITPWICNQTMEKSQCILHMMDISRYTIT